MKRVTLLFAHGGGFCKETWEPIIRRIRESPLLSTAAIECVTFDFKYHGGRRDETVVPVIDRSNPASMRVQHPAQDLVSWISADAWEQVRAERAKSQTQAPLESQHELIGIGHSMGAVALWKTEVEHPGTFDGLVLFEPGYGGTFSRGEAVKDFVVSVALEREKSWPTRKAATLYFKQLKNYSKWDREVLAAYLRGALVDEADGSVSLFCHPHIEASLYCHEFLFLSDE